MTKDILNNLSLYKNLPLTYISRADNFFEKYDKKTLSRTSGNTAVIITDKKDSSKSD